LTVNGTDASYSSRALQVTGVIDAKVVGFGNSLMTRDNSVGGKIDLYVRGERIVNKIATYTKINDNDFLFPLQPVKEIVSVTADPGGGAPIISVPSGEYQLVKDTTVTDGSNKALDKMHWVAVGEYTNHLMNITYSTNDLVSDVQTYMESSRIITTDLMIKAMKQVEVECYVECAVLAGYNSDSVTSAVVDKITALINKTSRSFTKAGLIRELQNVPGVGYVKTDTTKINRYGSAVVDKIDVLENEYLTVRSITATILP
jgi:hypothetical protein